MDKATALRMATELNGKTIAGWKIGKLLGSGGSALVLDADRGDERAALKVIDPALEQKFGPEHQEARVAHELRLVGRKHPHVVQIYDGGRCKDTGLLFVAMENLPYQNLDQLTHPFPPERLPVIVDQIAQAARYLESLGICHRDIKPENICITPDLSRAIVLDLGILRPLGDDSTLDAGTGHNFIGTYRYSPPEFVRRKEEQSEEGYRALTFYQIGAVLHDLIMGRKIFDEVQGPIAALIDCVTATIPKIENPAVDQRLVLLARDCLQKDWRLRLRLVNWDSFFLTQTGGLTARERVRAIIEAAGPSVQHEASTNTLARAEIERRARAGRDAARAVAVSNSDFPRATIDFSVDKTHGYFWVEFEGSPQLNLAAGARLTCKVSQADTIWLLEGCGSWGEPAENCKWQRIAALRDDGIDLSPVLEDFLYRLISGSMNHPAPDRHSEIGLA
jgi:serine/threonine protein kinase